MWYAIAAIVAALVGVVVWAVVRAGKSGKAIAERDALRDASAKRRKGDAVMAEPVADEDAWLVNARKRLARVREQSKP